MNLQQRIKNKPLKSAHTLQGQKVADLNVQLFCEGMDTGNANNFLCLYKYYNQGNGSLQSRDALLQVQKNLATEDMDSLYKKIVDSPLCQYLDG